MAISPATTGSILFGALSTVDAANARLAARRGIAGEPFGIGRSFDPRRPLVRAVWGTGLSAPTALMVAVGLVSRRRPEALAPAGALMLVGALAEPVFWGRRPCPRWGRVGLLVHVALAAAITVVGVRARRDRLAENKAT